MSYDPGKLIPCKEINGQSVGPGSDPKYLISARVNSTIYQFWGFHIHLIYLKDSIFFEKKAKEILKHIKREKNITSSPPVFSVISNSNGIIKAKSVPQDKYNKIYNLIPDEKVWEMFSAIFSSTIFGFTAIKSYVSELMPNEKLILPENSKLWKKIGPHLTPEKALNLSLKEKIFQRLPLEYKKGCIWVGEFFG